LASLSGMELLGYGSLCIANGECVQRFSDGAFAGTSGISIV